MWVKTAPSAAVPVAMPTCRNVELMPEAMPARCGSTTLIAAVASAGLTSADAAAGDHEAGEQRGPVVARPDVAHQQQPEADEREPARDEPADAVALRELARDGRDGEREQRDRQEAQAGLQRAVAQRVLDVEREVEEHREHRRRERERGERGAVERRAPEQREVEHRRRALRASTSTNVTSRIAAATSSPTISAERPALGVAADQREDQAEEAAGERDEPGQSIRPPASARATRRPSRA